MALLRNITFAALAALLVAGLAARPATAQEEGNERLQKISDAMEKAINELQAKEYDKAIATYADLEKEVAKTQIPDEARKQVMQLVLRVTHRKCLLVNLPFGIAKIQALFLGLLPNPPLTLDQLRLLRTDNTVSPMTPGLSELGVTPTAAEAILPTYLWRFRKLGEFEPA